MGMDATNNWRGSPTGPCRELPNGKWVGKGDKVSGNVNCLPWLPQPTEFWQHLAQARLRRDNRGALGEWPLLLVLQSQSLGALSVCLRSSLASGFGEVTF
jgi:hypothetical protein